MKKVLTIGMCFVLLGFWGVSLSYGANTIKVGFVDTYSGPASVYCFDVVDGFKMAIQAINGKGGVLGKQIEYTTRDEKFNPATGLAMAKELVMREEVDILAGTINSATTLAVSDFAKTEKTPF